MNTGLFKAMLRHRGPLYVAAVYPEDVIEKDDQGGYTPWFVAHLDDRQLSQEVINKLVDEFDRERPNVDFADYMMLFTDFLETKGYIVLHSGTGPSDDGLGYLTVNCDPP